MGAAVLAVTLAGCGGGGDGGSASSGGGGGTDSAQTFCIQVRAGDLALTDETNQGNGIRPMTKSELASWATELQRLAGEASDQPQIPANKLKDNLTTLSGWFGASANGTHPDQSDTDSALEARDRLSTWADQNCGST
jgi:hypothetical protein